MCTISRSNCSVSSFLSDWVCSETENLLYSSMCLAIYSSNRHHYLLSKSFHLSSKTCRQPVTHSSYFHSVPMSWPFAAYLLRCIMMLQWEDFNTSIYGSPGIYLQWIGCSTQLGQSVCPGCPSSPQPLRLWALSGPKLTVAFFPSGFAMLAHP